MITKITSFTTHQTAEGMRIAYTYSIINSDGSLKESNKKATLIVLDNDINACIVDINAWLLSKVPQ